VQEHVVRGPRRRKTPRRRWRRYYAAGPTWRNAGVGRLRPHGMIDVRPGSKRLASSSASA